MSIPADTISPLVQLEFAPEDTLNLTPHYSSHAFVSGMDADLLPYSPRTDNCIALVLLCCFVLLALTLARSKKLLSDMMKGFAFHRERTSFFAASTSGEVRFLLLLLGQSCVLGGVVIFNYFIDVQPSLVSGISPHLLLAAYIGFSLAYLLIKWVLYSFLCWIFLDKTRSDLWMSSYFSLVYFTGFLLFPFALLLVYFDLSLTSLVVIGLVLVIFTKLLVFYKWIKLFFDNIFGLFLLIVYFCALEIMPCFMVYQGLIKLNELLVIKF